MASDLEGCIDNDELLAKLDRHRKGRPLREFAAALGDVSFQNLGKAIQGKRSLPASVVQLLGYAPVTVFRPLTPKKKASKR